MWLESLTDTDVGAIMEENKITYRALEQLLKKQEGVDEDDTIFKSLAFVLYKNILNIHEFRVDQRKKEMLAAERVN